MAKLTYQTRYGQKSKRIKVTDIRTDTDGSLRGQYKSQSKNVFYVKSVDGGQAWTYID